MENGSASNSGSFPPPNPTTTPLANAIATGTCPVGYGRWNSSTCKPCPVGWTTTSGGATQDMWQGCTVPCSEAMMSNASTGCKGAWYQTLSHPQVSQGVSCTAKCAEKGLRCNWQALNFTSTVGHARSVFDLLGVSSSCNPSTISIQSDPYDWGGWGAGQRTCGGCTKTCFYHDVELPSNVCDLNHLDYKRMCPCGDPSAEGRDMPVAASGSAGGRASSGSADDNGSAGSGSAGGSAGSGGGNVSGSELDRLFKLVTFKEFLTADRNGLYTC